MQTITSILPNTVFLTYILVFALAALACFISITRTRQITDVDTRRGVTALVGLSGVWATAHLAYLLAPSVFLQEVLYNIGMVVGIATVGPWLYFCSAYTGRTLHKSQPIQRAAIVAFVAIGVLKVTNPIHQLYYRTEVLSTPFPHLAIHHEPLHWILMGLSYALATVGYFMIVELFWQVGHDTKPLTVLVGLTGLPILFNLIGEITPALVSITYEPLGVAVFAIGVAFIYLDDFQSVQLTGESTDAVVVLNDSDRIRDYNLQAKSLFPTITRNTPITENRGECLTL